MASCVTKCPRRALDVMFSQELRAGVLSLLRMECKMKKKKKSRYPHPTPENSPNPTTHIREPAPSVVVGRDHLTI